MTKMLVRFEIPVDGAKMKRALGRARTSAEYHDAMFYYHIKKDDGDIGDLFRTVPVVYHIFAYCLAEANVRCIERQLDQDDLPKAA